MGKNLNLICERCSFRLEKKGITTTAPVNREMMSELKNEYVLKHGKKPNSRTVLTTCLGTCPANAISYIRCREGKLGDDKSFNCSVSKDDIKKMFF